MKKKSATLILCTLSFLLFATRSQAQCGDPANLQSAYSNNVSAFTWDAVPGATEYSFEIDWEGGGWSFGEIPVTTNSYSINGLMQGGRFQWRVRANCNGTYGNYVVALYSSPCLEPYGLSTAGITTTSALLKWKESPAVNHNNTGYSVSYRRAITGAAWIQLTNIYNNIKDTTYNLTGLLPGTAYEWRVKRACAYFNSNYVTGSFVTLACIPNGTNTGEWISRFSLGTISRLSGAEAGGYVNTGFSTDLVIGSTNNAGQIGAGFPGNTRNERFNVYIDFNRNGSFADPGEAMLSGNSATTINGATIKNFNLTIPGTATAGPARMRVVMRRSNNGSVSSCITGYPGEAEDYWVNLIVSGNRQGAESGKPVAELTEKMAASSLRVAPNPSAGVFSISQLSGIDAVRYEVTDLNGKTVIQKNISPASLFTVDLSGWPKGLYLLRVIDRTQKIQTLKLIVQ
jgi:GEVED domain/Secretion system C-terminal sorting domain/Fibronectin type III domain